MSSTAYNAYNAYAACCIALALWSQPASAQSTVPASPNQFQVLILPPTGDPLTISPITTQTTSIGPTQNCGIDAAQIPPPPPAPVNNPLLFAVDDPYTAGRKCRLSFPTGLPAGQYQWAGVWIAPSCNPSGQAAITPCPSPRAVGQPPFSIVNLVNPPAAPTGLTFTQ